MSLDELPTSGFHKRVAFVAAGGPFCDGYLLGIVVAALPLIAQDLALSAVQIGMIGAATLLGMFLGGLIFGPITDKYGRHKTYVINLLVFVLCSVAHLFVRDTTLLIVLRLIMGVAIGADYPIATALATELLPRKLRGPVLSSFILCFWLGYCISLSIGIFFDGGSDSWRYILASAAIPSMAFLVLRAKIPESPRWLLIAGKREEAARIVTQHFGPNADFEQLVRDTPASAPRRGLGLSSIIDLFKRGYGGAFVLCATFWTCQVVPSFAIKTFQPVLLKSFGVTQTLMGSVLITSFAIFGTALGMLYINRIGRRPLILVTFIISSAALALLATPVATIAYIAIAGFILFTVSEAAGSALQYVYPNELFPTDLRATGMGISLAVSRIGAAVGTFFFPLLMKSVGPANSMLLAAGLSVVGLCVCYAMAPETTGRSLDESPEKVGVGSSDTRSELSSGF